MNIFAIELSSRFGSLALVEDGHVVSQRRWEESFDNRQQLFDAMADMNVEWERIDCFAAGRGPGAFSGMRIGFSVVNALAAPGQRPVYALNSGAALAAQCGAERTVVVGDARRGKVWMGLFSGSELEGEYRLLDIGELVGLVPPDALVVSPDHDRLEKVLAGFRVPAGRSCFPEAGTLGLLVSRRLETGLASEPFEPLYMHPPVFIAPRFA